MEEERGRERGETKERRGGGMMRREEKGGRGDDGKGVGRRPYSHPLLRPWNTESEITSQKLT